MHRASKQRWVVSSTGRAARALEENLLRSPGRPITGAHRGLNTTYWANSELSCSLSPSCQKLKVSWKRLEPKLLWVPNGVPYGVFKKCKKLCHFLWVQLKVLWRINVVPETWNKAEGVYIPKEENSQGISMFQPISLLHVDGKIFMGIFAARMASSCWQMATLIHLFRR